LYFEVVEYQGLDTIESQTSYLLDFRYYLILSLQEEYVVPSKKGDSFVKRALCPPILQNLPSNVQNLFKVPALIPIVETHTDTERGGESVSGAFGYFSHFHRLTKLIE
jgi:hypothetical protein